MSDEKPALVCLDAIRIACEAGDNDLAKLRLIQGILEHAPGPNLAGTEPVALLIEVMRALGGRIEVR